ncbi:MAG: ATP-binding protein [Candidatus Paceibacterota bacterium]|jgi:hypothetical protein
MTDEKNMAEVVSVFPNKIKILVNNIEKFKVEGEVLAVGSYLKVFDHQNCRVIAIIENFSIEIQEPDENGERKKIYVIEAIPLGIIDSTDKFIRGGNNIAIPPKSAEPATKEDIQKIYNNLEENVSFCFSKLTQDKTVNVPVDGNKFFNKHIAIVGSTGSGKSHTVAKVLQEAVQGKKSDYQGLNNSHIVIFDIHGEYKNAFPDANYINSGNIKIPYWLFDSEELGDLFIESNEENSHNQVSQFRYAVTENKKIQNTLLDKKDQVPESKIYFDSPIQFKIDDVIRYIKNINNEVIGKLEGEGMPKKSDGSLITDRKKSYFSEDVSFCVANTAKETKASNGPFNGDFERFILRLETIRNNPRLKFLFDDVSSETLEGILRQFLGYSTKKSNVTIIDLSGIPFEVLSITVSLISRMLFEYGYYYKKILADEIESETPLLLVYEEAHKYVPKSDLVKYRASRTAIERIAKEGRKYGVTLCIVSQRPSEISETIFSQCSNFIAMRLTNPEDQNYVKRLLPDTLGSITETLPILQAGEALLIGDSVIMPSIVKIDACINKPKSGDIKYLEEWKEEWKEAKFAEVIKKWQK